MKKLKRRAQARRAQQQKGILLKRIRLLLSVASVCLIVIYGVVWSLEPTHFPITAVKFIGQRHYLSHESLQDAVLPHAQSGFFGLKVGALQKQLLGLPWLKQVQVRKVWPNQLIITFVEHQPVARWGETGLLSQSGVLFFPHLRKGEFGQLPLLQGPISRRPEIWQQYLVMNKTLSSAHLHIQRLMVAQRGSWDVQLSNGILVFLGTNDILSRLDQFLGAYQRDLHLKDAQIAYADMRYTSGMAIGWKRS